MQGHCLLEDDFYRYSILSKRKSLLGILPKGCSFAWQRPTLPEPCGSSTLGAGGLNGRVRDGNAWFPSAIITKRCAHGTFRVYSLKTRNEAERVKHPGNT